MRHIPIIPATRETEAGESLEPGKMKMEVAVSPDLAIALQPGQRVKLCLCRADGPTGSRGEPYVVPRRRI